MSDNTEPTTEAAPTVPPLPPPPTTSPATTNNRLKLVRVLLLLVVPLLALGVGAVVYLKGGRSVDTENAYVKADKVPVSAEISGVVTEVLVQDNQRVQAGQALFRIDTAPFQVAASKAEARLAQVRQEHAETQASYREKLADIALARSKHAFALREQQRMADLVAKGFISTARFDDARNNADIAEQQIGALEQGLRRIAAALGGGPEMRAEKLPSYQGAMAEMAQARLNLAHAEVRTPTAGTVSRPPKPGQYLSAGTTAMALVAGGNLWIEANFPETDLTHVQVGQLVNIRIDTYPDHRWQGVVDSLSPATGAEFSVIPAQNATGNWVKIAQRVMVRIRLEPAPDAPQLRAGLSAGVEIDTRQRRQLLGFSL